MTILRILAIVSVCALCVGVADAQVQTIPFTGQPELTVTPLASGDLQVHVEVGELQAFTVQTPAGTFTRLLIPGFHDSQSIGEPLLPMMNRLVAMPYGAQATVDVQRVETRTVSLADFGAVYPVMPAQPSLAKNQDPATVPFAYHADAYAGGTVRAGDALARVVPLGRLRAVDVGRLEIAPVSYAPQAGTLEVATSIDLRIAFTGADRAQQEQLWSVTCSPFFDVAYAKIDGSRSTHTDHPDHVADVVTYVIITPSMFTAQLQPFIEWKTERGFHVVVGEIGTPEVGSTTTSIQSYIRGLWDSATVDQPAPSFVLFVGDVAQCPTFQVSGDPTDRLYCTMDGDYLPDIYYGRFSATNSTQLAAILDKTLMYDQFTMPDPSYLDKVVLIAGMDSNFGSVWANGQINYGTRTYFNAEHGIVPNVHLYPQSGSQAALIVSEVSEGRAFVNYTAHGSETGWYSPAFTQGNVNSLQNDGKYGLVIGNCCLTSTYDYPECFAETWLRAPNKGAIGYIGGSNSTLWNEDYWWGVGYTSNIVANPTYESTGLGAYDGMFHDHGEDEDQYYVVQDAVVFCGNLAVMQSGSGSTNYYWNIYNLMGDPSISPYLGIPVANAVDCPASLDASQTEVAVTAAPCSYAGLTQDGHLVGAGTIHEGQSSVTITLTQPLVEGVPVKLVVMAQNRVPYVVEIPVGETPTAAGDAPARAIVLEANVPNPFNPATSIGFALPTAQAVTLSIYDARGQHVATLVDEVMTAGRHDVTWTGCDDGGRPVGSGTYFCRLVSGGVVRTGKMLLAK